MMGNDRRTFITALKERRFSKENKLIALYEEGGREHRIMLNWRYAIFAGHLTISGILYSEILKATNNDYLPSAAGLIISIVFFVLHIRTTKLCWQSKNFLSYMEKQQFCIHGVYSVGQNGHPIKTTPSKEKKPKKRVAESLLVAKGLLFNLKHTGIISWTIVFLGIVFLSKLILLLLIIN